MRVFPLIVCDTMQESLAFNPSECLFGHTIQVNTKVNLNMACKALHSLFRRIGSCDMTVRHFPGHFALVIKF